MTVTSLAVPMAKTLAPVVAPALRDAVTSTLNARNARHAARSARTMALIGVSGQLASEAIQTAPVLMTQYEQIRAERHRHQEAMQQHARALAAIQTIGVMMQAEMALLADVDRAGAAPVLAGYRRDLMLLAGIPSPADH